MPEAINVDPLRSGFFNARMKRAREEDDCPRRPAPHPCNDTTGASVLYQLQQSCATNTSPPTMPVNVSTNATQNAACVRTFSELRDSVDRRLLGEASWPFTELAELLSNPAHGPQRAALYDITKPANEHRRTGFAIERRTGRAVVMKPFGRASIVEGAREALLSIALRDVPNVVPLMDIFLDSEGQIVLVMPMMETITVPMPFNEAADNFSQLLDTLEELEKSGVVHRDLTPWNILRNPDTSRLCIIDFGESFLLREPVDKIPASASLFGNRALYGSTQRVIPMNTEWRASVWTLLAWVCGMSAALVGMPSVDSVTRALKEKGVAQEIITAMCAALFGPEHPTMDQLRALRDAMCAHAAQAPQNISI